MPWKRERRAGGRLGRDALRAASALLLLLWLAATLSVMRGGAPQQHRQRPSSSHGIAPAKSQQLRRLDDHMKKKGERRSLSELSMFGNASPSDFQRYTPKAPSCSEPLEASSVSYTLVSQLSYERIWMVRGHCLRWGDYPMSIVILTDRSAGDVKSQLVSEGCHANNLAVRTVARKYDPSGTEYPVNLLRNMALSAVRTSHAVYVDVDFWPSSDLLSILSGEAVRERFASDPKLAAVIPAFQIFWRHKEHMPQKKEALLSFIEQGKAGRFDPTNRGGHGSTNYLRWGHQKRGTFLDLPCVKSNRYEPYLVFRYCNSLPPFQEGFTGYGKNKMTWAMQLRRSGYLFSQIGGAFLVHYPHLESKARIEWGKKPAAMETPGHSAKRLLEDKDRDIDWRSFKRARTDALFLDFKEWLDGTVEDESRVPMCKKALNDDDKLWAH